MQRTWVREAGGWLGALAVALIVSGQVASTARADLLFRDADSLIVALFARALTDGTSTDWAMSSVLFLPETAAFAALDLALPLDVNAVLAVSAVVNLLALYGALRLVAGRRHAGTAPVAWALIGLAAFGLLAVTETSASRDALEPASPLLTTTYYSATIVAVVLAVGLIRRHLDGADRGVGRLLALAMIAAASTLSNPMFVAWATVPLAVVLAIAAVRREGRGRPIALLGVLLGASILGVLARIPFATWITNTGVGYIRPAEWVESLGYYADLLGDRLATPLGIGGAVMTLVLLMLAVRGSVRGVSPGQRVVALAAWILPVLVVVGAIALGTQAARYLQPLAFAPVLALVARPRTLVLPRRVAVQLVAAVSAVLLAGSVLSAPRLAAAAGEPDDDLLCVTDWVDASNQTGAGQFWTVRLPKLHLADPARLVQVDHQLNGYAWLVDRADFDARAVSFLVEDAQTVPWQLPVAAVPDEVVDCGRYRILDFGDRALPIGPAHG